MGARETIARAVCCGDAACYQQSNGCPCVAMATDTEGHAPPTIIADAILAALRAAGFDVVPSEPTEAMFMTGGDTRVSGRGRDHLGPHRRSKMRIGDMAAADAYRAMLSASRAGEQEAQG